MADGWIKLHRKIDGWEWKSNPKTLSLFVHLLITANYEPSRYRGYDIPAGSVAIGLNALSEQTGLSVRGVRTALKHLKTTNEVTIKTTNHFSIVSITKWNEYQGNDKQIDIQTTNKRQTNDKPVTTSKETKKERREEKKEAVPLVLPHWLPILEWEGYCQHRGRSFTLNAKALAIRKLDGWRQQGYDPAAILNESTMNGWKGLFEPKEGKKQNARQKLGNDAQALLERIGSGEYS